MGHYLFDEGPAFQDFHFVVEVVGHGEAAHALQGFQGAAVGAHGPAAGILFLDENAGGYVVHRSLVTEVDKGQHQADDYAGDKPGPVDQVFEDDFVEIERTFFRIFRSRIVEILFGHNNRFDVVRNLY